MIKEISGKDNRIIKLIRSLHTTNGRKKQGLYFIEGERIVSDTIKFSSEQVEFIIFTNSFYSSQSNLKEFEQKFTCYNIPDFLFEEITDTKTPQGILAVLRYPENKLSNFENDKRILILDRLQDPGNMGTIIRTAEAMGINSIFITKGCTDLYSPKVLRSAMGSAVRTNFYYIDSINDILNLKTKGYKLYAAALSDNAIFLEDAKPFDKTAIIIGNEANGISDEILDISDYIIKIPMTGNIESLNAAIAASIVMYHFAIK